MDSVGGSLWLTDSGVVQSVAVVWQAGGSVLAALLITLTTVLLAN